MKRIYTTVFIAVTMVFGSCADFVELDNAKTQIVSSKVFSNDAGARAAITGIFSQMMGNGGSFAGGGSFGITVTTGLSSDELNLHSVSPSLVALYNNHLTPTNSSAVSSNWSEMYSYIYESNAIIEGAEKSTGLSKAVKDQVIGEAKFVRAFCYFYLVNLFGDVPLLLTTDYRINKSASRTPIAEVYAQIETDLLEAQKLLLTDYSFSGGEKVEPNKWAATALLARVYLYQKKWSQAEEHASAIINSNVFSLPTDLNSVFLMNSEEAILQLMPVLPGFNTNEGPYLIIATNPSRVSASASTTSVFEAGDARATSWLGAFTTSDGNSYQYAFKYKIRLRDQPLEEYYMVFRLAEQYLIRAEARAMQNNFTSAIEDLNMLRERAQLAPIDPTGLAQPHVLDKVEQERRAELFIEWGHRWFDLKRSGKIDAVLGPIKPDWQSKDALFPIPQSEINANPNLVQNP